MSEEKKTPSPMGIEVTKELWDDLAPLRRMMGKAGLMDFCPECGEGLEDRLCKLYCTNEGCTLFRCLIENCGGD